MSRSRKIISVYSIARDGTGRRFVEPIQKVGMQTSGPRLP